MRVYFGETRCRRRRRGAAAISAICPISIGGTGRTNSSLASSPSTNNRTDIVNLPERKTAWRSLWNRMNAPAHLLAIPVLAGSAAYAIGEACKWPIGLSRHPSKALSPIDPIKALYWTAAINGVVAEPVMTVMMLMTAQRRIMGKFTITGWLRWLGWALTFAMAACVIGMIVSWFG